MCGRRWNDRGGAGGVRRFPGRGGVFHDSAAGPCLGPAWAHASGTSARPLWRRYAPCSRSAVTEAGVTGQGTLSLGFDDGTRLSIEPDPDDESWSLTGSGIDPVLVGPGGETDWQH
ncbi:DUF6188 family protein [Streptomyces sp. NPDC047461]|uniref:DUF6188 family protein n=1 Tax=Streptomyces sp. NPDC047461 TaxID=3155619 RepID=UPI0033D91C92